MWTALEKVPARIEPSSPTNLFLDEPKIKYGGRVKKPSFYMHFLAGLQLL